MIEEQNVFIPAIEVQKAAKESFVREGKISFVLTKRDAKKIEKHLKLIKVFLSTKKGSLGAFGVVFMASRMFLLRMYALLFNDRINSTHEFFENNYKQVGYYAIGVFERNNKMKVITFHAV